MADVNVTVTEESPVQVSVGTEAAVAAHQLSGYAHPVLFPPSVALITSPLYGAKCDAKTVNDVTTTAASPIISSPTAGFVDADVGKVASLRIGSARLTTTILSVESGTQATLALNAPASGSAGILTWGTDDAGAVEAAIAAVPPAGQIIIPGPTLISRAVVITKNLSIQGTGHGKVMGGVVDSGYGSGSSTPPYLEGSVLIPTTPGQNAIEITGTGVVVNIRDLGIRFGPGIMFLETGHGIVGQSSEMYLTGHENGPMNCRWDAVTVWGHDGNHYAFWFMNGGHLSTFSHLQSQGGGGLYFGSDGDSTAGYGNSHFEHCFFEVIAGGTAHGAWLDGRQIVNNTTYGSSVNLISFMRPQCNIAIVNYPKLNGLGIPTPTNAQYLWRHTGTPAGYEPKSIDLLAPDLEPGVGNPVDLGGLHKGTTVRRTGTMPIPANGVSTEHRGNPLYSTKPILTPGPGLGGGTASWTHGNDQAGLLQLSTGASPAANAVLVTINCPSMPPTGIRAVLLFKHEIWGQSNKHYFTRRVAVNSKEFDLLMYETPPANAILLIWVMVIPAYAFAGERL